MYGLNLENESLKLYDAEVLLGVSDNAYPVSFHLERIASVKDQKETGGCLACTLATIGEYYFNTIMSEGWNYGEFRTKHQTSPGLYASTALEAWKNVGEVPKSDFGIMGEMKDIRELTQQQPELLQTAEKYRIKAYASLNNSNKEKRDAAIKDFLSKYPYPLVGTSAKYFHEPHAIVIDGWDDEKDCYTFQNSWGASYNNGGYDEIPKVKLTDVFAVFFEPVELPFKDVSSDRWSYNYIKKMYFNGLMNGTSKDTFEPEKPLTREEMAAILARLCDKLDSRSEKVYDIISDLRNTVNKLD